jgi:hypothetical protein
MQLIREARSSLGLTMIAEALPDGRVLLARFSVGETTPGVWICFIEGEEDEVVADYAIADRFASYSPQARPSRRRPTLASSRSASKPDAMKPRRLRARTTRT